MNSPSEHPPERILHSPSELQPAEMVDVIEYMQAHPDKSCTDAIKDATGSEIVTSDIRKFIAEFKARVIGGPIVKSRDYGIR